MRTLILFLATGAYSGYAPVAPGTVGSLVAIPFVLLSDSLLTISAGFQMGVVITAIGSACWLAGSAERYLGAHDSGIIVIDEMVGMLTATLLLELSWPRLCLAFFLFRLFDIFKPPPARFFDQKVAGGLGVVLDDVCAGLYANLIVRLLL